MLIPLLAGLLVLVVVVLSTVPAIVAGFIMTGLFIVGEVSTPKLTSINHPKEEMGSRAAELILDMVLGKANNPRYTFKPALTLRSSCRSVA